MPRIATWNVNSLRVRMDAVLSWLAAMEPDALCLQELKAEEKDIPFDAFRDAGYRLYARGQKSYNGVGVAAREGRLEEVALARESLGNGAGEEEEARYIEITASLGGDRYRIGSAYFPNGNPVASEKFEKKLAWMGRFEAHARSLLHDEEMVILAGDYNVIPEAHDVWDASRFEEDALYRPEARAGYRRLLYAGYTDALRAYAGGDERVYSFWDYQGGAFRRDHGLRIDHLLLSPRAADRVERCEVDKDVRALPRPSDHAPVWLDLR